MRHRSVHTARDGGGPVRSGNERRTRRGGASLAGVTSVRVATVGGWIAAVVLAAAPALAQEVEKPAPAAGATPPAPAAGDATPPAPAAGDATPPAPAAGDATPPAPAAGDATAAAGTGDGVAPTPDAAAAPATEPAEAAEAAEGGGPRAAGVVKAPQLERDELNPAGYVPGYRGNVGLGLSPHAPRTGGLAGGTTASYGAPLPLQGWTFKWSGFMTTSLQFSIDDRPRPSDGQSGTVFHTPPATIDSYGTFVSTSTVPGNWVGMTFYYGNARVGATVSVDTWNPTQPTTYYGMGSQYFINNAFVTYTPEALGKLRLRFQVGRFAASYGGLSRYGAGIYTNTLSGSVRGVGELTRAELPVGKGVTLTAEHGLMGTRDGTPPSETVRGPMNGWRRPLWAGAFMHHAHLGFVVQGKVETTVQAHYLTNWSQEDRAESLVDNPGTMAVNEEDVDDGRLTIWGGDVRFSHDAFGYLGLGVAYVTGHDAYPLKGLTTYGGEGEQFVERWWGVDSGGTGTLLVTGINYNFSIGKLVNYPGTFAGDGPDIVINTGFHLAHMGSEYEPFDGQVRHKYGLDGLYTFHRYMGAGLRLDRVAPNSDDSGETFHVVAPRLVFRSNYNSHEMVQLIYAKWFYGPRTRNEGTGLRTPERLDDQMVALNFNMWW